jgi:hypothetical protein
VAQPLPNLTLQQLLLQPDSSSEREPAASSTTSSSYISRQGQQLLNTCSSEALCELLRHLKRAYWPFPWDTNVDCYDAGGRGSTGGFRCAFVSHVAYVVQHIAFTVAVRLTVAAAATGVPTGLAAVALIDLVLEIFCADGAWHNSEDFGSGVAGFAQFVVPAVMCCPAGLLLKLRWDRMI